jgi:osmotically-inducible protein OsmY
VARLIKLTAGAAGAGLAIAAAVLLRRRSPEAVADRARLALDAAFGAAAGAILVRAERGVVTLRGEVDQMGDISRYEAAIRAVPGVRDVDNLLRLRLYGVAAQPAGASTVTA